MKKNTNNFNSENESIVSYVQGKLRHTQDGMPSHEIANMLGEESKYDVVKKLIKHLSRAPLGVSENCEDFTEYLRDNSFLAKGTDTVQEYAEKLGNRSMTRQEYDKIMKEIEENGSILPISSKRKFTYGGGSGDVILSETTGKMYCVEDDRTDLLTDYKGIQYYRSRSLASGEGYIITGKKSIIYLPTSRIDVADPSEYNGIQSINGVKITAWANRGIVDHNYPITISPEDNNNDFIFVDSNNVLDIIGIIKSGGVLPENFKTYTTHICNYFDEHGEQHSLDITYMSDKPWPKNIIIDIIRRTKKIENETGKLEPTGSEFARVMGIYKSGDNFVEKSDLGLATQVYGKEDPLLENESDLYEYEIGVGGKLEKVFYDKAKNLKLIRGWKLLSNTAAYKLDKSTGKYIVMVDYKFSNLSLSEGSKDLLKYFACNKVGGVGDEHLDNYTITSNGGSVIFVSKNIEESDIQKVVNLFTNETKNQVKDIYEKNLRQAFSETLKKAELSEFYKEGRESHKDLLYTCFEDKVYLGYIVKNTDLNDKFASLSSLQDYEKVITKEERELNGKDYWESYMRDKAYEKSIKDYVNFYRWDTDKQIKEVRNYLENNKDKEFFIQDSIEAGNCLPGTQGFMEKYQLKEGITGEELLEHKRFEDMIQNNRFRNVILNKVSISID